MSKLALNAFPLQRVEQMDEYCVNGLALEVDYLTSFQIDKLLAGFRETAGLDMKGEVRYGGWEDMLIGGHAVGHYMTAMAQAYANAGVSAEDHKIIQTMIYELVDGLLECQRNSKGKPGYLFGATLPDKENVEAQFDNVEKGLTNIITQAWVPWYTMHKLLAGAIDIYKFTGYENALILAKGIGDWTYERAMGWDEKTHQTVLSIEYGGMNDSLYELYAITQKEKYAVAAHRFDEEELFEAVYQGKENVLNDLHANTTIPKFIGALNRYVTVHGKQINGEIVDASRYLAYAKSFWTMVIERHTYITGANSEWEHFGRDYILNGERTNCNNETCNVYNMLKLSRTLFSITGEKKYADYYEIAFYNSILSSQNPLTGMTTYFQPMATGYFKVYGERYNKFWCCTGSGMENFTKLSDSIYFYQENALYINLYFSSQLTWKEKNLSVQMKADFPYSDEVSLTLQTQDGTKITTEIHLRIPEWVKGDAAVSVNGKIVECPEEKGYVVVRGDFRDGDEIRLKLPMEIMAVGLPDDESVFGFQYGPVVLSADLGTTDMESTTTGVIVTIPAKQMKDQETVTLPEGVDRATFMKDINKHLVRVNEESEELIFHLQGTKLFFAPHYLRYKERYGIYFYFKTREEVEIEAAKRKRTQDVIIDTVQPGYGQYENDVLHDMQEENTKGVTNAGTYRYAEKEGYFTYRMAVKIGGDNFLSLTLRAEDNGKTLQIKSGETVLFAETLDYIGLEKDYELRVQIPSEVVAEAQNIEANDQQFHVIPVTFSGIDGAESAKVCEFIYMIEVTQF